MINQGVPQALTPKWASLSLLSALNLAVSAENDLQTKEYDPEMMSKIEKGSRVPLQVCEGWLKVIMGS